METLQRTCATGAATRPCSQITLGRLVVTWWSGYGGIQAWSRRPTGFLQCLDTGRMVMAHHPLMASKIVPQMTYNVLSGMLSLYTTRKYVCRVKRSKGQGHSAGGCITVDGNPSSSWGLSFYAASLSSEAQRPIVIKLSRGRFVGRSVCPVHCGKTADRIRMPFGIIGRTGPAGMSQVGRFGDRSTGMGTLRGEFGACQWDFTANVCDSASTVGAAVRFGVVRAVGRGIAVLDGVHVVQGEGKVFWGVCSPFHNGKCHWIANGEMFLICMFGKRIVGKLYSWAFWRYIQFQDQHWGFWEISKKSSDCSTTTQTHAAKCCGRNMHIHECTPQRSGARAWTALRLPPHGRLSQRRGPLPKLLWAHLFS